MKGGIGRNFYLAFCGAVFVFLIAPILVIVPLSFNAEPYFTFTEEMLRLDPDAWSLRWYRSVAEDEEWRRALVNSIVIGVCATALATVLGTLAALGLANPAMRGRALVMTLLISPMVTPVIVSAAGMFFFYSSLGLAQTHLGLILAHAALGTPFVVITVTATLAGFDTNLVRVAASLGAGPWRSFWRVQFPLIAPGVISGALFAFATSFDEVVAAFDLASLLPRRVAELSGGERQRVALARSLLTDASLLLLDEPMSALDTERKADILSYLESLSVPMLYVSHAVDEVALLAERTVVLADGRVRAFGATREILERLDIQSITGRFEAGTLVRARVVEHDPQYQLTILEIGGQRMVMPMSARLVSGDFARVRVRARDVALATTRPQNLSIRNVLSGTLIDLVREEDSPFAEALVEVGDQHLQARITRASADDLGLSIGQSLYALVKSATFEQ